MVILFYGKSVEQRIFEMWLALGNKILPPIGTTDIPFKCYLTANCTKGWKCYELALSNYSEAVDGEVTG